MKHYIFCFFALFTVAVNAQQEVQVRYAYPEWEVYQNKPNSEKYHVNVYSKTRNGKRLEESILFEEKGLSQKNEFYNRNGTTKKTIIRSYNDSNRIVEYRVIKKNKPYKLHIYSYKDYIHIVSSTYYYKDTITPSGFTSYKYYPNHKCKSYSTANKKNKQQYRYEYDYYDNGSRKETRFYTKTKLKHTWVYDCDPKGALSDNKTVKICKNRTYEADSSFTEIYESTIKGKANRNIIKSTADGRVLENTTFDAKGKMKYRSTYEYNSAQKLVKHLVYKGAKKEPSSIEMYEYNADESLIASIRLNGDGEVKYRREFSYN